MAANHGGRREGAGRKLKSETIRTRAVARQLEKREVTPLHILVETMTAYWEQAQRTSSRSPSSR